MSKNVEIIIDGYSVYFDELNVHNNADHYPDANSLGSKIYEWTSENLERAMKPVLSIMNSLKKAASDYSLDEIELTTQVNMNLKGEVPIFKIISAGSSAQMSVTLKWKNINNNQ